MTKAKFSNNIGIDFFYKLFRLRKITYPKGYFFFRKYSTARGKVKFDLFKKLILTYQNIYFDEFYTHNNIQYFPLSGKIMKVKGKGVYKNQNKITKSTPINWIWFSRPAFNYVTNLSIHKLAGGTSRIYKLETAYKENFDVGLLPNCKTVLRELNINNKLHQ